MESAPSKRSERPFPLEPLLAGLLLLVGIVLRLRQYLLWRSLWLDEAMLALNIVHRDYLGLLQLLDWDQAAPVAFLLVEKFLLLTLGNNELVLRLFPLFMGILSSVLFYLFLQKTTSGMGTFFGLGLFVFAPELIYYSSEVKQYTIDVAVTLLLFLLALPVFRGAKDRRSYVILGLVGLPALWFSHPALFVLAGIGVGLLYAAAERRDRQAAVSTIIVGGVWVANLALLYFLFLRVLRTNSFLFEYWQENFVPVPPWSNAEWWGELYSGFLHSVVGVGLPIWMGTGLLVIGLLSLWKRDRPLVVAFVAIWVFVLSTSALGLYPVGGRFTLFIVPLLMMVIGVSLELISRARPAGGWVGRVAAGALGIALLYTPFLNSLGNFTHPKNYENIRPAMAALAENWREGSKLYVSYGAYPAFLYYAERYGLGDIDYVTDRAPDYAHPENLLAAFAPLIGQPRVWVLITHVYERGDFNERDFLVAYLDSIGEKRREIGFPGSSVYLFYYDLSP